MFVAISLPLFIVLWINKNKKTSLVIKLVFNNSYSFIYSSFLFFNPINTNFSIQTNRNWTFESMKMSSVHSIRHTWIFFIVKKSLFLVVCADYLFISMVRSRRQIFFWPNSIGVLQLSGKRGKTDSNIKAIQRKQQQNGELQTTAAEDYDFI